MAYRNGNYSAFYVTDSGSESNLRANATKDFVYYNLLRAWKADDADFPFNDSHMKNYNVRDGSDWDKTLKPRIRERLSNSKNIVFFLSSITKSSRPVREEIDFGINTCGLPVIAIYPEFKEKSDIILCEQERIRDKVKSRWANVPIFNNSKNDVPVLHIPLKKSVIRSALKNTNFMVGTKCDPGDYFYPC